MRFCRLILVLVMHLELVAASAAAGGDTGSVDRPNIILIYADDLGIGLLGCYGQRQITTPNIDRLAAEGIRFSDYYGSVYCAPARWSLLTGMHDGRMGGWKHNAAGLMVDRDAGRITESEFQERLAAHQAGSRPIHPQERFLAEVVRAGGYETAQFGKLDSGFLTWHERIRRFGWDHYLGYMDHQRAHGFYPPYLWLNGARLPLPGNPHADAAKMSEQGDEPVGSGGETYSQNVFLQHILRYLRDHREERFFVYHSTQLPHGPVAIPTLHPDVADREDLTLGEKKYASMVKMLDDHVGLILKALSALGLDEKTLVMFTADNGHELYYGPKASFPRRIDGRGRTTNFTDNKWRTDEAGDVFDGAGGRAGLKRSGFQGGVQLPLLARWPGRIPPGRTSSLLTAQYDILPTLADVAGTPTPPGKDGISFLPTLLGEPQESTHDYVVINNRFTGKHLARTCLITRDGWKLVELDRNQDHFQLYHVVTDNEEREERSAEYPERVQALKTVLLRELDSPRPDWPAVQDRPPPSR